MPYRPCAWKRTALPIDRGDRRCLIVVGCVCVLVLAVFALEAYALWAYHVPGSRPLPQRVGNTPANIRRVTANAPARSFSFAVVGDTRGSETFEDILSGLRDEPLAFLVLLGDCVRDGTEANHRFFRSEWNEIPQMPFPVFYVVGNHDVDRAQFPISRFETLYGPTNFTFDLGGCRFVFLRVLDAPWSNEDALDYLRHLVAGQKAAATAPRQTLVFMHIPPAVSSDFRARGIPEQTELLALLDQLGASYVLAGDYHGYARVATDNRVYLVSGGGGSRLKPSKFGHFHHAAVLSVENGTVGERLLVVKGAIDWEDHLERMAVTKLYPWLREYWSVALAANLLLAGLLTETVMALLRLWRRRPRQAAAGGETFPSSLAQPGATTLALPLMPATPTRASTGLGTIVHKGP